MSETSFAPLPDTPGASVSEPSSEQPESGKKKKKAKVRSAWISFIGRIVAQMFGAVATVMLGLHVVQSYLPEQITDSSAAAAVDQAGDAVRPVRSGDGKVLAVLPLQNYSGDARQDAFSDGLTEAIIAEFARVPGLQITSRTSSMNFREERGLLPSIARQLGVDLVVEGSVVTAGDRIRITAQLIDAASDVHIWTSTYESGERDVLALQSSLAKAIVHDVRAVVLKSDPRRVTDRRVSEPPSNE
jgi:TolB-like protein